MNINNDSPLISVIVPVYNREKYLVSCLDNILNQSFVDFEVICVNDGSFDNSLEILEEYAKKDSRIKIINQQNCGAGCARNSGLKYSKGKFIYFMDSDDYLSENTLEMLYHNAISNNSDIVFFKIARFNSSCIDFSNPGFPFDKLFENVDFNNFSFTYSEIKPYVLNASFAPWTKLYKKDFLENYDDFEFPLNLSAYEDVIFHVKAILRASRISFVPEYLYYYRVSDHESVQSESNVKDILPVCNSVEKFLKDSKMFEEFKMEFIYFKITQLSQYIIFSESKEYYELVKSEFKKLNLVGHHLPKYFKKLYFNVINSTSFEDYIKLNGVNSTNIKVSVIIPVYNSSEFLDECIQGILNQSLKDIEIICVDDGSTDDSLIKLLNYAKNDNRLKIYHQENQGGGPARNLALTKAKGKYLYFMDSDDVLHEEALERCYEICEQYHVDFSIFKAINFNESTNEYEEDPYFSMPKLYDFVGDDVFNFEEIGDLIFNISVTPWGKLYNRDFVLSSGAQFATQSSFHDNKFFWEMLFNSKKIIFINETFYVRRLHNASLQGSKKKGFFDSFIAFNQIYEIFKKYNKFENFKVRLYNMKIRSLYTRFTMIHEDYKPLFFRKLQKEYSKMSFKEGHENFFNILNFENRIIFKNTITSSNYLCFNNAMGEDKSNNLINNPSKLSWDKFNIKNEIVECELNNEKIKVSVIIPVYNVESYLRECLDSIIYQSLTNIEIICINDGSTDNSLQILNEYKDKDDRISIINQKNKGLGAARNVGLAHSNGEFIYFIDSDDYLELTALEELYDLAIEKSLDLILFKLINFHDETGEKFQTNYYDMIFLRDLVENNVFNFRDVKDVLFEIAVSAPGKLFKKELISEMQFPENIIFEDNPFFIESIFKANRVYFYDKYLYNRRIRNNSITTSQFSNYSDSLIILNMIMDIVKKLGYFDEFADILYNRKISMALFRYNSLDEKYKEEYFEKMKEDFLNNKTNFESDIAFNNLNSKLKNIFYSVLSSDHYKEFDLRLIIFDLKNDVSNLKSSNSDLSNMLSDSRRQCENLKVDVSNLKSSNSDLSNMLSDSQHQSTILKNKIKELNFKQIRLKDSNTFLKNKNEKLLDENDNLKSTKSYKFCVKLNNVKDRLG